MVRTFVPVVAGVGRMPRQTFTVFNLIGALVWAIGITTVGFSFGGIQFVAHHVEAITIAIASVAVVSGRAGATAASPYRSSRAVTGTA